MFQSGKMCAVFTTLERQPMIDQLFQNFKMKWTCLKVKTAEMKAVTIEQGNTRIKMQVYNATKDCYISWGYELQLITNYLMIWNLS